jgi:hypothetical protein
MMNAWLKRSAAALVLFLIGAQFIRPAKTNPASSPDLEMSASIPTPPAVAAVLERSCNDCHSNRTVWPWYSQVAPASWLVVHDVNEGRSELNFSEWGSYDPQKQRRKLDMICREVSDGDMPEFQYTLVHRNAKLSTAEKQSLCDWAQTAVP